MTKTAATTTCALRRPIALLTAALCTIGCGVPVSAQEDDNSRAVHILEAPSPPPGPAANPPSAPSSSALQAPTPAPTAPPAAAALGTPPAPALNPSPTPATPGPASPAPSAPPAATVLGSPPAEPMPSAPAPSQPSLPVELGSLHGKVKVANSAELSVTILPGQEVAAGADITIVVTAHKPGYLILLDVDATGKVTQIYPNPMSLLRTAALEGRSTDEQTSTRGLDKHDRHAGKSRHRARESTREPANYIKPGRTVRVPDPADPFAGFKFVATPGSGPSMVVAMLSDRPVQLIDLPDLPPSVAGQPAAMSYLSNLANDLRIPQGDGGKLSGVTWSMDASMYQVRTN